MCEPLLVSLAVHKLPLEASRILLAATDNYGVLAAVRALRAAGYAPWLAIPQPENYIASSRAAAGIVSVSDPRFDGERFACELAAAAAQLSVAAVLPSVEPHLLALADREADFAGIAFGTPSAERVARATDKDLLPELAATAGLRSPPTQRVVCGDTETLGVFGFPAILKPLRSRIRNPDGTVSAYSAARYVSTSQEAEEALEALPGGEGLVQPYLPGQLTSIAGVSWEGELICALHQLSIRIWPVRMGVSSYAVTIPPDAELEQGVGRLLREIGWSGLFQTQFIRNPDGEHYLIDLNPRVYGSLALAVAAGLNLPGIWVDLLLGRRPYINDYRIGVRFRQEEKDIRALARMLVDGDRLGALQGFVPRRGTTHAIFSLRDPLPLLTSAEKSIGWPWSR
jgi:biotin carboxylase